MTDSASLPDAPLDEQLEDLIVDEKAIRQRTLVGRGILLLGVIASVALCSGIASFFSIPNESGFSISLLQQPHWIVPLFAVFVAVVASVFVSGWITRMIRPEVALACAGLGLASISLRGGTMQAVLFAAGGAGVFIQLAIEAILLFAFLAVAWQLYERSHSTSDEPVTRPDELLLAIFAHAAVMTALMLLICRSDAKMQTLVGVGVCAVAASFIARQIVTIDTLGWLWISPLVVALLGYILAWMHPDSMQIGVLHGAFAPLARPVPLDYAGMGTVGTIVGYWMGGADESFEEVDDDSV